MYVYVYVGIMLEARSQENKMRKSNENELLLNECLT